MASSTCWPLREPRLWATPDIMWKQQSSAPSRALSCSAFWRGSVSESCPLSPPVRPVVSTVRGAGCPWVGRSLSGRGAGGVPSCQSWLPSARAPAHQPALQKASRAPAAPPALGLPASRLWAQHTVSVPWAWAPRGQSRCSCCHDSGLREAGRPFPPPTGAPQPGSQQPAGTRQGLTEQASKAEEHRGKAHGP